MKYKSEYKLEYKVKTLVIREIIHLALKKNLNNFIQSFLNDIPEKSNYDIKLYCFGYARLGILTNKFNKSTQTFKKHISLNELHNNCYLILNEYQYNTLCEIYTLVHKKILLMTNEHDSEQYVKNQIHEEKKDELQSIDEEQHIELQLI
jgi:hypothetical protein